MHDKKIIQKDMLVRFLLHKSEILFIIKIECCLKYNIEKL